MSAQFVPPSSSFDGEQYLENLALKNKRFGLLIWRFANFGVFAFFILTNYLMRQVQPTWPPDGVARLDPAIPAAISLVLLLSSIPAARAQAAIRREDRGAMQRNILITLALGVVFLVGLGVIWSQTPHTGSYSAIFFTMTGFHALHALIGMLLFGYVFVKAQQGAYSKENHWAVEASIVFWHFVDLMWILYFVVLWVL
jgi:cytochrome c oxidase subunit 3